MNRIVAWTFVTLLPALAHADEVADGNDHGIPWAKLAFSLTNLVIFVLIIRRYLWPSVRQWVLRRRTEVVEALEAAARAKREADQLRTEWEQRLVNLTTELAELRRRAEADIAAERDDIIAAAQRVAETIRRDAEQAAEQEIRNAPQLLRAEVAKQAFAIACQLAEQRLTPPDHERFVAEFTQRVAK